MRWFAAEALLDPTVAGAGAVLLVDATASGVRRAAGRRRQGLSRLLEELTEADASTWTGTPSL